MTHLKNSIRGSITAPTALMLAVVCLFDLVLADASSIISGRYFYQRRAALALNSILASYDSILYSRYGLLGLNVEQYNEAETDFIKYITKPAFNNVISTGRMKRGDSTLSFKGQLSGPDALKTAIVSEMKYRSVANGALLLADCLGLIGDSGSFCGGMDNITKGESLLSEAESKVEELRKIVEGQYNGDVLCVNGFASRLTLFLLSGDKLIFKLTSLSDIIASPEIVREGLEELNAVITVYRTCNAEAYNLIAELKQLAGEIERYAELAEADRTKIADEDMNSELSKRISRLHTGALRVSNDGIASGLKTNIEALNHKSELLREDILLTDYYITGDENSAVAYEMPDYDTFCANLREALDGSNVKSDFVMNKYYLNADESLNQYDIRKRVKQELSIYDSDSYSIPDQLYSTLPSVRQSLTGSLSEFLIDFTDAQSISDLFAGIAGSFAEGTVIDDVLAEYMICDYVSSFFSDVSKVDPDADGKQFICEKEYIIGGNKDSDSNVKETANKLLTLRFALNFVHVLSDDEKHDFATAVGNAIAAAISAGIGGELYALLLMGAWSLGEAYLDVKTLQDGEKVPLIKTRENWKSSIEGLSDLFSESDEDSVEPEKGLDYAQYLTLLVLLMPQETVLLRIADVIEVNLTEYTGRRYMLSGVFTGLECKIDYYPVTISALFGAAGKEALKIEIQESVSY
ncbi:MAG: hypothetical protein J5584_02790 [Clostridia bacterium]|nr:hypothetical protein [Clostridia bacterium]